MAIKTHIIKQEEGQTEYAVQMRASDPGSPIANQLWFNTTDRKLRSNDGSSNFDIGGGSGGGINHNSNPDFESNASGYTAYADAAASIPVDGAGGAPTLSIVRTTTGGEILRGAASGKITKDAANRQGEGIAIGTITIPKADKFSVQRFSMDYLPSANYVDGDVRVYLYDITNAKLIEATQRDLLANANGAHYIGEFQTSDSLSYRILLHVASVNANAWTILIDNVQFGPREIAKGSIVTDWQTYTPAIGGFGTVSNNKAFYRRVGDEVEIKGFFTSGVRSGATATIDLPTGLKIDFSSSKMINAVNRNYLGNAYRIKSGAYYDNTAAYEFIVFTDGSSSQTNVFLSASAGSDTIFATAVSTNILGADGESLTYQFKVPISGWSSNSTISSDFGGRVIATRIYLNAATNHTSNGSYTKVPMDSISHDSVSAFNLANNRIDILETGYYQINGSATFSNITDGKTATAQIYKNGVGIAVGSSAANGAGTFSSSLITTTASLSKGDYIELYAYQNDSASEAYITGSDRTWLEVTKIQSPQSLMGSEKVYAHYTSGSGQSIPSGGSGTIIDFASKQFDSHNAVTTGASWKFTAPISGIYEVSSFVEYETSVLTATQDFKTVIHKNGSQYRFNCIDTVEVSNTRKMWLIGSAVSVDLLQGEYIDLRTIHNVGANRALTAAGVVNHISIKKL